MSPLKVNHLPNGGLQVEASCRRCGKKISYTFDPTEGEKFLKWFNGIGLLQDHFPLMTPDERELLITQICGTCFDELMREPDE